jgi:hypothetical protein
VSENKPNIFIQRVERHTEILDKVVGTTPFDKTFDSYREILGSNLHELKIRKATELEGRIIS